MIDAAVHLWSADATRYPWPADATQPPPSTPGDPERLFRDLGTAGVSRAVVVQSSSYGDDHAYLLDQVAASSGRLAGVGLLRDRGRSAERSAQRLLDAGCAGIRVIVGDDPGWLASDHAARVWRVAEARTAPVGLLTGPRTLAAVTDLAVARPDLVLVLDHLALIGPADLADAIPHLHRMAAAPGVRIKLSALRAVTGEAPPFAGARPVLRAVRDLFGPHRLIYGTDWPYAADDDPYPTTIEALDAALGWSADERELVVERNAADLWWR